MENEKMVIDFDEFDLGELDDVASKIPQNEPNSCPAGIYDAIFYDYFGYTNRKKMTNNLCLQWQIKDGKYAGEICQATYTLTKDFIKMFIFDMDRLGYGDEAREGVSKFIPNLAEYLNGCKIQLEMKPDKTGQYKNMSILKRYHDDEDDSEKSPL